MTKFIIYTLSHKISYAQIFEVDKPEEAVIKAKDLAISIAKIIDFNYTIIEVEHGNLDFQFKQYGDFSISMKDIIGGRSLILQVVPNPGIAYERIDAVIKSGSRSGNFDRDEIAADIANLKLYADKVWNRLITIFYLTSDELYSLENSDKLKIALEWGYV